MIAARTAIARRRARVVPLSTAVRGRARFRVESLVGRPDRGVRLSDGLVGLGGILSVRINARTGSVLVHFAPDTLDTSRLAATLVQLARPSSGRDRSRPPVAAPLSRAARSAIEPDGDDWHTIGPEAAARRLDVHPAVGLSGSEARERLEHAGPNRLPAPEPRPALATLVDQVASLPVGLLVGAAVVSLAGGAGFDAAVILGVVALNTVVGYATEARVERILTSLQRLTAPVARVRRDGKERLVPAATLVPGDVMALRAGHDVAADGRVVDVPDRLLVNESTLTGESLAVAKSAQATCPLETPVADRHNMVFAGTAVSEGSGLAVVTATGRATELGRIRSLVAATPSPPTPLERQLGAMGRTLVGIALGLCAGTFALGLLRGVGAFAMARTAISLAVAAVPEGLPAVATTTLALGMHRMLRRNVLVRRLQVIESLGATTVVCADKTGTLTENRMTVLGFAFLGGPLLTLPDATAAARGTAGSGADPRLAWAATAGALCNDAELVPRNGTLAVEGSPTEGALLAAARAMGLDYREMRNAYPLLARWDRADGQNWMGTVHAGPGGLRLVAVKGAPEEVVRLCADALGPLGEIVPMTPAVRRDVLTANARMAGDAMRVLGLAYRAVPSGAEPGFDGLTWVGLVGMADPIRSGVREAIAACRAAGIRIVMVTGDQSGTAIAVGRALGLVGEGPVRVLEAAQLATLDQEALRGLAREVDVFARVSPAHKHAIVRALQASGEVVAMTGDGVNDGPALRAADIGVALGAHGTEVARDLGDVVLLDDDFRSMVAAIEHGRAVHTNVRKALRFLLSTNLSEVALTLATTALGLGVPLSAVQLLWINLLSDVLPALALAVEPAEPQVMRRPPRDPAEAILSRTTLGRIGADAGLMAGAALAAYGAGLARHGSGPAASTIAFSTLTASQLLHALSCRSDDRSGLAGLGTSPALAGAIGASLALQAATVAVPSLRALLGTTPLGLVDWALVAGGAVLPLAVREVEKARRRRGTAAPGATP
jgi:Ca2+-transporting ATPase